MKRSGIADLPLHGGRVSAWLAPRLVVLGSAIAGRLAHSEKLDGFRRLDAFTRAIETRLTLQADVVEAIAHERRTAASLGGRTVLDDGARSGARRPGGRDIPERRRAAASCRCSSGESYDGNGGEALHAGCG